MGELSFRVLGPVEVLRDGCPVMVGRGALVDLLATLVLSANQVVAMDTLAETVWHSRSPRHPKAALQSAVARLRRMIGHDVIETLPSGYRFHGHADRLDLLRFEQLRSAAREQPAEAAFGLLTEALGLWRGAPLENVVSPVLLTGAAPRLTQLYLDTCEKWAALGLRAGRSDEVVSRLAGLVDEHPFREQMVGQLMVGLYRDGRQADAIAAYESLRRALAEGMGLDPGQELQELHLKILRADPSLHDEPGPSRSSRPSQPARSGPAAGPGWLKNAAAHQLPADTRLFTGRQAELTRLLALAEDAGDRAGPGMVAIEGMAGIGKTTLAVHAAHLLAARYGDGQLFIDLHGYTDGHPARTASQALETLLRALGVHPERIPDDDEERAALYRERLAGTRTLIVLDNAVDEAQVRPLIPGEAQCLVLVTSRRKLNGLDDAHAVALDVLSGPEAVALFCAVAGPGRAAADDPAVAEVAALCGDLPLAVRIAAALLRSRPAWDAGHLAAKLRNESTKLSSLSGGDRNLAALFDLSSRALDDSQQRLYRCLGLVPGPEIDAYAAAALLDTDPVVSEQRLQELVDHNLLQEHSVGRYRMHDLIRAHTRALAIPAPEREQEISRLLGYYQHTAARADAQLVSYGRPGPLGPAPAHAPALPDSTAARGWLRAERANLIACLQFAIHHEQNELTVAFVRGLSSLLRADGPWAEAIVAHTAAVAAAARTGDRHGQACALTDVATVHRLTGDYTGAERALRAALELCAETGSKPGHAWAQSELGVVKRLTNDYQNADHNLQAALTVWREMDDKPGQAYCLIELGIVWSLSCAYEKAQHGLRVALMLYRELRDKLGEARCLVELAKLQQLTGNYSSAIRNAQAAVDLCKQIGERLGQANALTILGRIRRLTHDYDDAVSCLLAGLDAYQALGNRMGQANAQTLLGEVRCVTGDLESARRDLEESIRTYEDLGLRGSQAYALNRYAAAITAGGEPDRAIAVYQNAMRLAREVQQSDDEAMALHGLGENYLRTGRVHDGTACLRQALEIYRRLGMPEAAQVTARLAGLMAG